MKVSMAGIAWWLCLAFMAGCPSETDDDDDTTGEEPEQCGNFGLANIQYDFLLDDPEDILGYGETQTDAQWWTDLAYEYANDDGEPNVLYFDPSFGVLVPVITAHEEDTNGMMRLDIEYSYAEYMLWLQFWYYIPGGVTVPVEVGEAVYIFYIFNFVTPEYPATAPMFYDGNFHLLFYGEPGANGLAYSNDPMYPDETANPIFASVTPRDLGCSANLEITCGEQYNLQLRFETWDEQVISLWPGESETIALEYDDGTTLDYDVSSVWSYDWRNTTCAGAQYERNYAFFVMVEP